MPPFIFTYRHPADYVAGDAQEGRGRPRDVDSDVSGAWVAFFERIGPSVIDPGQPVFERTIVGEVGVSTNLGGYSVVQAGDLASAEALAAGCPTLQRGGGIEIGLLAELPADHPATLLKARSVRPL